MHLRKYIPVVVTFASLVSLFLAAAFTTVDIAKAQMSDEALGLQYGSATGLTYADPRAVAAAIIRASLSVLGTVALVIIIIAGYTWMTAGGNEEKVGEAKKWLSAGIIGLIIILSAYAITSFVVRQLLEASTRANNANLVN